MSAQQYPDISFGRETFYNFDFSSDHFAFDWAIEPGYKVMEHLHKEVDEFFEVTKGEITFKVSGKTIVAKTGDKLQIRRGTPHEVTNRSREEACCRVHYTPVSDQDKFMRVCHFLIKNDPAVNGKMIMVIKAFYLNRKLGFKDFSSPASVAGAMIFSMLMAPTNLVARLQGWSKLAEQYRQQA